MEEKANNQNQPNPGKRKKPYYKKRYNQPPRKKKFWNADKIVSLSAMAIALFTLVVLLYQSHILDKQYELTVKQQKAAVLPYVQIQPFGGDDLFSISIENKGLGPAFIKGLFLKEKDSTFLLFNLKAFYDQNNSDTVYGWNASSVLEGFVLSPGEKIELFSAQGGSSGLAAVQGFFAAYFGFGDQSFFIEYESVFGDAWISNSSFENIPKEEYEDFVVNYDLVE